MPTEYEFTVAVEDPETEEVLCDKDFVITVGDGPEEFFNQTVEFCCEACS